MNQVWETLNEIPEGPLKCTIKQPNGDINIDECKITTKYQFTKEMTDIMIKLFTTNQDGLEDTDDYLNEAVQMRNSIIDEIFKSTDEKLRIIEIQTFVEILSLRNKKPKNAVMKGIAARHNNVTAAVVFVIDQIKEIIAIPKPIPPINPDSPIFL